MSTPPPPPCSAGRQGEQPAPAVTTSVLTAAPGSHDPRALLDADAFMTVTATLAQRQPDMGWVRAEQVVAEALKFVAAVAEGAEGLVPSALVDAGWHALIVNTEIYQQLGQRLGGFVHHYPAVAGGVVPAPGWEERTAAAIERAGFIVDKELWT
ncbi:glycine-rich domain-containing protein [Streptomyces sp. NPDC054854]